MRSSSSSLPITIDDCQGPDEITRLFGNKYNDLYQSVSYDNQKMDSLKSHVQVLVNDHCVDNTCICVTVSTFTPINDITMTTVEPFYSVSYYTRPLHRLQVYQHQRLNVYIMSKCREN